MKLYFVTGNKNKLEEIRHVLSEHEIQGLELHVPEIQGEPEDVIAFKASQAAKSAGMKVFVEDTCLMFDALNGLPGPYIKHFIDKLGLVGLYRLIEHQKKDATAISHIAFAEPGREPVVFSGETRGTIVVPRGSGWGWDNLFVPEGTDKTYGENAAVVKERCFRTKALKKFRVFLEQK